MVTPQRRPAGLAMEIARHALLGLMGTASLAQIHHISCFLVIAYLHVPMDIPLALP